MSASSLLHFSVVRNESRALLSFDVDKRLVHECKKERLVKTYPFTEITGADSLPGLGFRINFRGRPSEQYVAITAEEQANMVTLLTDVAHTHTVRPEDIDRFSLGNRLREGYVDKKGTVKWSRRWLVVTAGQLFCFKAHDSRLPLNAFHLDGVRITVEEATRTVSLVLHQRSFVFRLRTTEQMLEWVTALRKAQGSRGTTRRTDSLYGSAVARHTNTDMSASISAALQTVRDSVTQSRESLVAASRLVDAYNDPSEEPASAPAVGSFFSFDSQPPSQPSSGAPPPAQPASGSSAQAQPTLAPAPPPAQPVSSGTPPSAAAASSAAADSATRRNSFFAAFDDSSAAAATTPTAPAGFVASFPGDSPALAPTSAPAAAASTAAAATAAPAPGSPAVNFDDVDSLFARANAKSVAASSSTVTPTAAAAAAVAATLSTPATAGTEAIEAHGQRRSAFGMIHEGLRREMTRKDAEFSRDHQAVLARMSKELSQPLPCSVRQVQLRPDQHFAPSEITAPQYGGLRPRDRALSSLATATEARVEESDERAEARQRILLFYRLLYPAEYHARVANSPLQAAAAAQSTAVTDEFDDFDDDGTPTAAPEMGVFFSLDSTFPSASAPAATSASAPAVAPAPAPALTVSLPSVPPLVDGLDELMPMPITPTSSTAAAGAGSALGALSAALHAPPSTAASGMRPSSSSNSLPSLSSTHSVGSRAAPPSQPTSTPSTARPKTPPRRDAGQQLMKEFGFGPTSAPLDPPSMPDGDYRVSLQAGAGSLVFEHASADDYRLVLDLSRIRALSVFRDDDRVLAVFVDDGADCLLLQMQSSRTVFGLKLRLQSLLLARNPTSSLPFVRGSIAAHLRETRTLAPVVVTPAQPRPAAADQSVSLRRPTSERLGPAFQAVRFDGAGVGSSA